jgi:hypothetical protein
MFVTTRFNEASLEMARSGAIWGAVWMEINGEAFPAPDWNDMVVAVMVELLGSVREVSHGSMRRVVRFFDGPFCIEFARRNSSDVAISAGENAAVKCDLGEFRALVRHIEDAASELVAACKAKGWSGQSDVRRLEALLTS